MNYDEEILLDHYRMLRTEIESLIGETRKMEVQVLGAIAVLYGWLATHPEISHNVWYLATLLALFGGVRSVGLFIRMGDISAYMRETEQHWSTYVMKYGWKGWETHFGGSNPWTLLPTKQNHFPLSLVTGAFWVLLTIGTLFAPDWFIQKQHHCSEDPKPTKIELSQPVTIKVLPDSGEK